MFATKEEYNKARAELTAMIAANDFSLGNDTIMRNLAITLLVGGPWGSHEQTKIFCTMVLAGTEGENHD